VQELLTELAERRPVGSEDAAGAGGRPRSKIRASSRAGWRMRWRILIALVLAMGVGVAGDSMMGRPSHRVFFGLDVPNGAPSTMAALASKLHATPTVTSLFVKLDTTSLPQMVEAIPDGITPFVTLEPWSRTSRWDQFAQPQYSLRSIITGTHDADLLRLARQIAALHRTVYLRFAHEMNGSWYPWAEAVNGNQDSEYQQAWRHVHELMQPVTGKGTLWVWSPNIVTTVAASSPQLRELYPGDGYVDYVGMSGYSHGQSVPATFCPTVSALEGLTSKPIVLSEIGVDGPNKANWLRELGPFVKANPKIAGFVYFNTSPQTTGATGNYRIDQHSSDLAALHSSLAQLGDAAASVAADSAASAQSATAAVPAKSGAVRCR
jgi:hypothetical protein